MLLPLRFNDGLPVPDGLIADVLNELEEPQQQLPTAFHPIRDLALNRFQLDEMSIHGPSVKSFVQTESQRIAGRPI